MNAWYNAQIAAGKTPAQINAELAKFDVWDRYDYDGDGNFDEPDGYIDHFQSVHAGEGEETGGGAQGAEAIWSHRWYAFFNLIGSMGPPSTGPAASAIGDSNYWIGDYTVEPENGGVGVFAHEFGHDLDLPDLYDTNGRRQLDRLLDADVVGLVRQRRHGRTSAPSRCTWAPGRSSSSAGQLRGGVRRQAVARTSSARPTTTPSRPRR